jgi:hypothetical protein
MGMTTTETHNHEATCLMCAVRALTEGDPAPWIPNTAGQNVSGVVLKMGTLATNFGPTPYVDLWTGGQSRIRIQAFGQTLRHAIDSAAPQIGDTLSVWFDGDKAVESGRFKGMSYKAYSANVQRGHGEAR